MKMSNTRRRGFGLLLVLAVLAVLGGAMAAFAMQSSAIAWQTQRMLQQAQVGDLQASGLAWARHSRAAASLPARGQTRTLNAAALDIPGAAMSVELLQSDANQVRVTSQCGLANRTVHATACFDIRADKRPR